MLLTGWCELQPESAAGPRCPVGGRGGRGWGQVCRPSALGGITNEDVMPSCSPY